jgi:integrase
VKVVIGTVERRGKNSFRLTVSGGIDSKGNRIRHRKTIQVQAKSEKAQQKEAEKALSEFVLEVEKGEYFGQGKMTLKDFAEKWVKEYAEKELAPKTLHRYQEMLELRIIPILGHLPIDKIRPMHLVEFYNALAEDGARKDKVKVDGKMQIKPGGLSPQTIRHHHRLLSTIFSTAVQWQLLRDNPAGRVRPPKVPKTEVASYDEEQTTAMLASLDGEPLKFKVAVMIALTTGCRRGELLALKWNDIDFNNNFIRIDESAQYIPGKGHITKDPKNESSKRTVPVPSSMMPLLKKYKSEQNQDKLNIGSQWQKGLKERLGADYEDPGNLFTTWDGGPMFPDTLSKLFREFIEKHNLPKITFHGLRHTAATLLIGKGVQDLTVSALLGHSDPGTTKRIYAKSLKSAERAAADMMESIINIK